jgi:hypothetical protein
VPATPTTVPNATKPHVFRPMFEALRILPGREEQRS